VETLKAIADTGQTCTKEKAAKGPTAREWKTYPKRDRTEYELNAGTAMPRVSACCSKRRR
jgi:hypothetical protein